MIFFYNILYVVVIIIGLPLIIPMILITEKRRKTVLHRLGLSPFPGTIRQYKFLNPDRRPIWIHALSVGEVLSAVQLVRGFKTAAIDYDVIFSVSTKTGFDIAKARLSKHVLDIFYFPYDLLFSVERVLGQIDPALVLVVETDIWPNFLQHMKKRNIPVVLVNARLSERSFSGYRRLRFFIRQVLANFAIVCVQSKIDAQRFRLLGLPSEKIFITGNFKFDQPFQSIDSKKIEGLREKMNLAQKDKILIAGSTHKGEEAILSEVFSKMKSDSTNYRFIVVPRDPKRADSIRRIFESSGLSTSLLRDLSQVNYVRKMDVLVVDVIGILRDLYALADCTFIGGSLVSRGGHNPLEPAAFSKPIVFGPDMSNFKAVSDLLIASEGAIQVKDSKMLYTAVTMLMANEEKGQTMGENAFQVFAGNKGAVEKTLKIVRAYLPDGPVAVQKNN